VEPHHLDGEQAMDEEKRIGLAPVIAVPGMLGLLVAVIELAKLSA
jgi:hypothetical protein